MRNSLCQSWKTINKAQNTACDPDDIHYAMLKNLPLESLNGLLQLLNKLWFENTYPPTWEQATIIPILKPNKDSTDPSSYGPIALTSCLCKTFETMVNVRLLHILETRNMITPLQSGFRKGKDTTDHILRLETWIMDTFAKRELLSSSIWKKPTIPLGDTA